MTTIVPGVQLPPLRPQGTPRSLDPGAEDFASLLGTGAEEGQDLLRGGSDERGTLPLRDRIAQLFNEFGFFPPARPERPGAPHLPDQLPAAVNPIAATAAFAAAPASAEAPATSTAMPAVETAPVQAGPAASPTGADSGAVYPLAATDSPAAAELVDPLNARIANAGSAEPRPQPLRPSSSRTEPPTPVGAGDHHNHPDPTTGRSGRPVRPVQHWQPPRTELRDRLLFRVGDELVEIVARLKGLGEDEEAKLVDALKELLESHGLSLGSATLNGRPFAPGGLGAQA